MRLVLASTSPARLQLLRAAGIEPIVIAPEVDEELWEAQARAANPGLTPDELVLGLARAKAEAVAALGHEPGTLVLGADSTLDLDGRSLGKPLLPETALERWGMLSGAEGRLVTGHHLIDPSAGRGLGEIAAATVGFASLTPLEIERYVATGEPLGVAGGFTLNGIGAPFVERVSGDAPAVIGLSLATLRRLVIALGHDYQALWN